MLRDGIPVIASEMRAIISGIEALAREHAQLPMLSRTHGQTASPTTLGKEMANVAVRLTRQLEAVESVKPWVSSMAPWVTLTHISAPTPRSIGSRFRATL